MKVLFLDIDGVLNSRDRPCIQRSMYGIDPWHTERLNEIVERCGCDIVISSTWRIGRTVEELRALLEKAGFRHARRVIGKTGSASRIGGSFTPEWLAEQQAKFGHWGRGLEIMGWLRDQHGFGWEDAVKDIVILDDDSDMWHLTEHLVQTSFNHGLTQVEVNQVCSRFGVP